MKAGGGKQKGAEFERETCKILSKWITDGERNDIFWRSAMSGGRATVLAKKGESADAHSGDISCTHWLGSFFIEAFSVECKSYKDLNITGSLTKRKGALLDFWKQAVQDAARAGKRPFLVAKQNRHPTLLCIDPKGADIFKVRDIPLLIPLGSLYPVTLDNLFIYNFDEFISSVDPAVLETTVTRRILLCQK